MHPVLTRPTWLALYLGAWIPVAFLLGLVLAYLAGVPVPEALAVAPGLALVLAFVCLSALYPARALPLENARRLPFLVTHLVAAVFSTSLWLALGRGWVAVLERGMGWAGAGQRFREVVPGLFLLGILFYALAAALHYLGIAWSASREAEKRALELQVLAREAELRALRAQIDPHFLFNSLNSISALTGSDAPAARRMCLELGDFLRRTIELGARDRIPLSEELDLCEGYLRVEQIRFGPRLKVERAVKTAALETAVPPLLLQPLIENAVRHGIAHRVDGGTIRIEADRRGSRLHIAVQNPRDPEAKRRAGAGLGLANVAGRLRTLFGGEARLETSDSGDSYRVLLDLPAPEVP